MVALQGIVGRTFARGVIMQVPQIDTFFVDLSGTVHVEDQLIPGAEDGVNRLRRPGNKFRFVTNTTKQSKSTLVQSLVNMGLDVKEREVYSSLSATRDYVIQSGLRPYFILTEDAQLEFRDICTDEPNAVVVGLAPEKFTYEIMNTAFRILDSNSDAQLVATHQGRYYKTKAGLNLGPGAYIAGLEFSTGKPAVCIGKPSQNFFGSLLKSIDSSPDTAIMIGDDVRDDVIGALKMGMSACLVKTGKYRPGDEDTLFVPPGETESVPVKQRALVVNSLIDVANRFYPQQQ